MKNAPDYVPSPGTIYASFILQDLIDEVQKKYGNDVDLGSIIIDTFPKQYKCFGYDQYDSDDYQIEINFHKN